METRHQIFFKDAAKLDTIKSESIDLIVTSPPYPMIEMWDDIFIKQDLFIEKALKKGNGNKAFELMHKILDSVWNESFRVLKEGGFACINIGDATRTLGDNFALYSSHSRILHSLAKAGFTVLPEIIWRKQTNAPNKFMGSGMLPAGAYVTLEHEFILVARKGGKRVFKSGEEKLNRHQSAVFWEERNNFFSDIWFDIKGSRQALHDKKLRKRSGAFPFELAYRLINMYSVKKDTVLDPFAGTGTTMAAAMASARNSVGYEIDKSFHQPIKKIKDNIKELANSCIQDRLEKHILFVKERIEAQKPLKYENMHYGFAVVTAQEKKLLFNELKKVSMEKDNVIKVSYFEKQHNFSDLDMNILKPEKDPDQCQKREKKNPAADKNRQMELF